MKPEQQLWRNKLKPALEQIPGLVYERIELSTSTAGMPDVLYTYNGHGFIELKVSKVLKKYYVSLSNWTIQQRVWAKRHVNAGGKVLLLIEADCNILLVDPKLVWDEAGFLFDMHPSVIKSWLKKISIPPMELASAL